MEELSMNIENDYKVQGTSEEEFVSLMNDIISSTKTIRFCATEVDFLTYCPLHEGTAEKLPFYMLSNADIENFKSGIKLRIVNVLNTFEKAIEKELKQGGFLFIVDSKKIVVSENAVSTLSRNAGVTGEHIAKSKDIIRAMILADGLQTRQATNTYIVRSSENGTEKIFSSLGKNYELLSHDLFLKALDFAKKSGGSLESFYFDHNYTRVCYYLDEKNSDFRPGFEIISSDTGKSSVIIKLLAFYKGSKISVAEEFIAHEAGLNIEEVLSTLDVFIKDNENLYTLFVNDALNVSDSFISREEMGTLIDKVLSSCVPKKHRTRYAEEIAVDNKKAFYLEALRIPLKMKQENMPILYIQGAEKAITNLLTFL